MATKQAKVFQTGEQESSVAFLRGDENGIVACVRNEWQVGDGAKVTQTIQGPLCKTDKEAIKTIIPLIESRSDPVQKSVSLKALRKLAEE